MRQHVNPLSRHYKKFEPIPPMELLFGMPNLPLHIDIGCASGDFLFELANQNTSWNYLGIEIREKLVLNAQSKLKNSDLTNLFFLYGNVDNLISEYLNRFSRKPFVDSISLNFPDPWFKKKHHKRRVLQPDFLIRISEIMKENAHLYIKSDVEDLFDYMNLVISESLIFEKLESENNYMFNPQNTKTEREIYVSSKKLPIYKQIYQRKF